MATEFPQEIVDEIIDHIADNKTTRFVSLRDCSLVSSQWLYRSQKYLFHEIRFTNALFSKWCDVVQPGDGGPSPHVAILDYDASFNLTETRQLAQHHHHLSSFTNLQELQLRAMPIYCFTEGELSMCFKQMGRSVRSVSLRACEMTVNDLASFIHHFTKLERLSIIDPVAHSTVLDDSVEFPILGGVLELQYLFFGRGIWDFVHQLSQLPLVFHTVVLEGIHISLLAPVNELLATCRETLTRVDIRDHFVRGISLTDCDALREMHLNTEVINHLPSIIQTVTSRQLKDIRLILLDSSLEKHFDYLDEWELIDAEICALADRVRPAGREGWKLSVRFVVTSAVDAGVVGKSAARLLSASSRHKHVTISTDLIDLPQTV